MRIIIPGGGIAGLFAALVVKELTPDSEVLIIESERQLGGLLSEVIHDGINFDKGVHTFYETGSAEIDKLFFSVTPEGGWNVLSGLSRDVGGIFQDGKLNSGNSYLNYMGIEVNELKTLQKSFLENFGLSKQLDYRNAYNFLESKFGSDLVNNGLSQYITKFTGADPRTISASVASILPLSRVNLFSEEIHKAKISDREWNSRISYPDQRRLPESLIPSRSAYYPSNYGTQLYIDALVARLTSLGVVFRTSTKVVGISSSKVMTDNGDEFEFDFCFWATHPINLMRLLGEDYQGVPKSELVPMNTAIVSYLLTSKPSMNDLYYAYDSTPGHLSHRFSSPINFCQNSKIGNLYRFTNEVVYHDKLSDNQIMNKSSQELFEMGIFNHKDVQACYLSRVSGGYPNLNTEAISSLQTFLQEGLEEIPKTIIAVGIMSEPGLFFQNDVLINVYRKIRKVLTN
jgi:protoporphyrinogen oxidase